jgi:hypothetical protein
MAMAERTVEDMVRLDQKGILSVQELEILETLVGAGAYRIAMANAVEDSRVIYDNDFPEIARAFQTYRKPFLLTVWQPTAIHVDGHRQYRVAGISIDETGTARYLPKDEMHYVINYDVKSLSTINHVAHRVLPRFTDTSKKLDHGQKECLCRS